CGGGAAGRLLAGCWRGATALFRGRYGVAGCVGTLMGLVPAPSAAAQPGPDVRGPLPGGQHRRDVLGCAGGPTPSANGLYGHGGLPGGLSHAALLSPRPRHGAPPVRRRGGRDGGRLSGWTDRGPSPPPRLVRAGVLGQWPPGDPGLHGPGLALVHGG